MIRSSACQPQADTHPALWDEPWSSKLHHSPGHDPRARQEATRVRKAAARLQRLPSLLRTLWDGFRKSRVEDRIRKSVETEMDSLRSLASSAAERTSLADQALRHAERKTRTLDRALAEVGAQRDDARRELAKLRHREVEIQNSPAPRPKPSGR